MRLHNLIKSGGNKSRKRIGRGEGGGRGKTSGRGHKGQRARSGSSLRPGFESGHVPLYRKLPKRGFNNFQFRVEYAVINVGDLDRVEGEVADRSTLIAAGLLRKSDKLVKILGDGDITKSLKVTADKFSSTAKEKIEKAGGSVIVPEAKSVSAEKSAS
jgi:large subunit ribosomal protein L15